MKTSIFALTLVASAAFANEPHRSTSYWSSHHFARVGFGKSLQKSLALPAPEHSLKWPVEFADDSHTLGNNMIQFQQYGGGLPYYHGGCDLRAQAGSWVLAPVDGKIEAGHYGYDTQANGEDIKWWKPYPSLGEPLYFEVAIVADNGYRFEIHHVDEETLPADIVRLITSGGRVHAGDRLGKVVSWPVAGVDGEYYNHVHYNIVGPNGVHWNPERFSLELSDTTAPVIHGVYAQKADGSFEEIKNGGTLDKAPQKFVVAATDQRGSDVYTQAPNFAELVFGAGTGAAATRWDFTQKLSLEDGSFPSIWSFYLQELRLSSGERLRTEGNYETNFFLIQLKTPANASGPFTVRVGDMAGNLSEMSGELR